MGNFKVYTTFNKCLVQTAPSAWKWLKTQLWCPLTNWKFEPSPRSHTHSDPIINTHTELVKKKLHVDLSWCAFSVPLRTGTSYIRDIFVLFLQDYCALQELLMKMNFTIAVAPPFVHPMTSLPATPTHSVRKYGFFSEPTRRRQVAKYGNLKRCQSLSFSSDIESLEPSKF